MRTVIYLKFINKLSNKNRKSEKWPLITLIGADTLVGLNLFPLGIIIIVRIFPAALTRVQKSDDRHNYTVYVLNAVPD